MTKSFFYESPILPVGFKFPLAYTQLGQGDNSPDLEPWSFLYSSMPSSLNYYGAMLLKYPEKSLIPFAIIDDQSGFYNGGFVVLACFDGSDKSGDPKVYFHDYSDSKPVDWSSRHFLANFTEWLKVAREESANYKTEKAEAEEE